jgi:hypothetical protein
MLSFLTAGTEKLLQVDEVEMDWTFMFYPHHSKLVMAKRINAPKVFRLANIL